MPTAYETSLQKRSETANEVANLVLAVSKVTKIPSANQDAWLDAAQNYLYSGKFSPSTTKLFSATQLAAICVYSTKPRDF